ncbi:aldo/keto reductase [Mariniplasma anaerobium]|uniref:Glyoxal reductase n=1 Tax=Mariniplasma anaerobium TaxID=2735436 RepID=A0A7U9XXI7_9MOLU|nr:aldo/keto reductase [Mariniplasma anaerobium]BCR36042.1 glyoxal reductase [Mariniplasma anaerobium]
MTYVELNNGYKMPQLGLGTFKSKDGNEAYEATRYALEIGYTHIDTAQMYGNEASIGQAIKDAKVNRKDIFITTKQKVHSNLKNMEKAFEESLEKLQTDYVDLYLIHWPNHDPKINAQSWAFFESLYESGKAKAIGISNFQKHHVDALLKTAKIKPMIDQVECHPGLTQVPLKAYLDQESIQIESYGPFMKGGVFEGIWKDALELIAKKHDASIAQVVIAWGLYKGIVMIPKSVTPKRIKENFESLKIKLTEEDIKVIDGLNRGVRVYTDPDNSPWGPYVE